MKTESKLKHYRHPRACKTNCDWPMCTQATCVDPDSESFGKTFKRSLAEVVLASFVVALVLVTVLVLGLTSFAS